MSKVINYNFYKFNNEVNSGCLKEYLTDLNNCAIFFKSEDYLYSKKFLPKVRSSIYNIHYSNYIGVNAAKFFFFVDQECAVNRTFGDFSSCNEYLPFLNIYGFLPQSNIFLKKYKDSDFEDLNGLYCVETDSLFRLIKFNWSNFYYNLDNTTIVQDYPNFCTLINSDSVKFNIKNSMIDYTYNYYKHSVFLLNFKPSITQFGVFKTTGNDYSRLYFKNSTSLSRVVSLFTFCKLLNVIYNSSNKTLNLLKLYLICAKRNAMLNNYKHYRILKSKLVLLFHIKLRTKKYFFLKTITELYILDKRSVYSLHNSSLRSCNSNLSVDSIYSSSNFFSEESLVDFNQNLTFTSIMLILKKFSYSYSSLFDLKQFNTTSSKLVSTNKSFSYLCSVNTDYSRMSNYRYSYSINYSSYLKSLFSFLNINKYNIINIFSISRFYKNSIIFPFSKISFLIHTYFFKNNGMLLNYLYFLKKHKKLVLVSKPSLFFFKFINRASITFIVIDWFVKTKLDLFMIINYLFTLNKSLI